MNRLTNIKPFSYFLLYLGMIILSLMTFLIWRKLVPNDLIQFGIIFIVFASFGGYLFWIYILLNGFSRLDSMNNLKNDLNRFKYLVPLALAIYTLLIFTLMHYSDRDNIHILLLVNILLGSILTYIIFETVIILTRKFKFYDNETSPNLWDYFVTMFLLCFYPFGLMIMHSNIRRILKENKILEK